MYSCGQMVSVCVDIALKCVSIHFLGAFVIWRKETISFFCLSLCLSYVGTERMNRLLMDGFSSYLMFDNLRKPVEKTQTSLKSGRNYVTCHKDRYTHILKISLCFLRVKRNLSDRRCTENRNTYLKCNFFRKSCLS